MKITITKDSLNDLLSVTTPIIDNKPVVESLTNVLLEADKESGRLTVTSSNGDVSTQIHTSTNLVIEKEGSILLDGKTFAGAVSKLSGAITIEKMRNNIKITSDVAEYKLNSMQVDLYPDIDFTISDNEFKVDGNQFIKALSKVINSTSSNDDRPIFSGVHMFAQGNVIDLVATDSYRLSKSHIELEQEVNINAVVLANTLKTIMKISRNKELYISTNNNKVTFRTDNALFVTRIIDGVYPDTNRLIPTYFNSHVYVDRETLINAVDRSSFMKENNVWILKLNAKDDILELITKAQEIGSTYETIEIDLQGDAIELNLNGKYLIDALNALEDDMVVFNLVGELQALTVSDSTNQVQLLLPIRTAS